MDAYDVVIVGAGPAGSSTALHLARLAKGLRVAIVERHRLPREKPCGGAVSRWGLDVLESLDVPISSLGVDAVPITAIRVRHRDQVGEHVAAKGTSLGAVVRRDRFDAALAHRAIDAGATLMQGARVVALQWRGDRWAVSISGERGGEVRTLHARIVVGADGTGSAVRRLLPFDEAGPRARLVVLETEELASDDVGRDDGGVIEFDLTPVDHGIDGYVWHFATKIDGARMVSRGIYDWRARRPGDAGVLRATLVKLLRARGVDASRVRFKPYTERVFAGTSGRLAFEDGVLLVGEAAGLVDPVTGEGIAQALASGGVAARTIAESLQGIGGARIDADRYAHAIRQLHCVGHLRQALSLAPHVYGKRGSLWAGALAACPAAIEAGVDWYVGEKLGFARKAKVGAALALRAASLVTRGGAPASRE